MTKAVFLLALALPCSGFCQQHGATPAFRYADGIEFKMVKDVPGKNAVESDILEMNVLWKVGKNDGVSEDSLVLDTRKMNNGRPITMPLVPAKFVGDMSTGLALMSAGDSGVIRVSVDSMKKNLNGQPMPPFGKPGEYYIYEVSMISVKSKADAEKAEQKKAAQQAEEDERQLKAYFASKHIVAKKLPSGVYYTIKTPGTGANIAKGKTVSIIYTGKTMDGKTFDSNVGKELLKFEVGKAMVIPGMDESMLIMKKGTKGTLYIPSGLAYGDHGNGPIAPNAILIFDMEIKDVK